jgi:hypothetical protein
VLRFSAAVLSLYPFITSYGRTVIAQSVYRRAMDWTIGVLGFDSRRGLWIFLFTTVSRTVLGPTRPPIQWVPGTLALGVKRPGREADDSPPSSAEVKNAWSYTFTPQYVFMAWCLVKHRDNFTFFYFICFVTLFPEDSLIKTYIKTMKDDTFNSAINFCRVFPHRNI